MGHVRSFMVVSAICGFALAAFAAPAEGQFAQFRQWWVCGGNAFNTCAAVEVGIEDEADGLKNVTMRVWNLSGQFDTYGATVFTKLGFFNIGGQASASDLAMFGPVRGSDDPDQWVLGDSNNAGGVSLELATSANDGNSSVNNSIASGCADPDELPGGQNQLWQNPCVPGNERPTDPAGFISFTFNITGTWDLASSDLLIMGQNGPDGESTQCITGDNCQVIPEPLTVVLLGSGLAGLAGAGAVRRRRRDELDGLDEDETGAELA